MVEISSHWAARFPSGSVPWGTTNPSGANNGQFHDVPCLSGPRSLMIWHAPGSQQVCTETNKGLVSQPCAAGKGRFHAGWWLSPRICNLNWFVTWKTNVLMDMTDYNGQRYGSSATDFRSSKLQTPHPSSYRLVMGCYRSHQLVQRDQLHSSCLAMF